jgi:hypothetical protein
MNERYLDICVFDGPTHHHSNCCKLLMVLLHDCIFNKYVCYVYT